MARTMREVELYEKERQSLALLVQAQWQVIMVRGELAAAQAEWNEEQDAYVQRAEQEHERAELKLEERDRELAASRAEAVAYSRALDEKEARLSRLRVELEEYKAIVREGSSNQPDKYAKLIELCMTGERGNGYDDHEIPLFTHEAEKAIVTEIEAIKALEKPF